MSYRTANDYCSDRLIRRRALLKNTTIGGFLTPNVPALPQQSKNLNPKNNGIPQIVTPVEIGTTDKETTPVSHFEGAYIKYDRINDHIKTKTQQAHETDAISNHENNVCPQQLTLPTDIKLIETVVQPEVTGHPNLTSHCPDSNTNKPSITKHDHLSIDTVADSTEPGETQYADYSKDSIMETSTANDIEKTQPEGQQSMYTLHKQLNRICLF
ncbi:unnamed protein product [Mytilus coruscus]|uniref:Uncharacterized protein n=1 Tax=Mytilus coruscus TaxID=42192 RepID=A0A6J8EH93_MYTCO|nr:unnamed protein product [Mytilus coruscus]